MKNFGGNSLRLSLLEHLKHFWLRNLKLRKEKSVLQIVGEELGLGGDMQVKDIL